MANEFPMEVDISPIQIFSFHDEDFQYELFEHETDAAGEETATLPNTEGGEIYHQLFKETEVFWGK
jgi:hypothetical protein